MYYHGVINGLVDKKIMSILANREISSAGRMGYTNKIGFNEDNYVSVCSNMGEEIYNEIANNAFNKYIFNRFCFVIDSSVEVEKPEYIRDASSMSILDLYNLKRNNPNKRFSDIIDEYQVRDYIPFDKIVAIGIPYGLETKDGYVTLSNFCFLTTDEFKKLIIQIESVALELGIPIVDSSSLEFKTMFMDTSKQMKKVYNNDIS